MANKKNNKEKIKEKKTLDTAFVKATLLCFGGILMLGLGFCGAYTLATNTTNKYPLIALISYVILLVIMFSGLMIIFKAARKLSDV